MKFYANENFPLATVEELRALGHDVLTTLEAGNANRGVEDAAVLAFATEAGMMLLTLNRWDFVRLSAQGAHGGIVVCSEDPDPRAQARRIHDAVRDIEDPSDQLVRVDRA